MKGATEIFRNVDTTCCRCELDGDEDDEIPYIASGCRNHCYLAVDSRAVAFSSHFIIVLQDMSVSRWCSVKVKREGQEYSLHTSSVKSNRHQISQLNAGNFILTVSLLLLEI